MNSSELQTPRNCISPRGIRAFLRASRKFSDDSLPTHLPRTGSCVEIVSKVLFPAWTQRDNILQYCEDVADQIANNEPISMDDGPKKEAEGGKDSEGSKKQKAHGIDPRIDPYGARDFNKLPERAEDMIRQWVRNERNVESIVRDNSTRLLADKCGSYSTRPESFLNAYEESFGRGR